MKYYLLTRTDTGEDSDVLAYKDKIADRMIAKVAERIEKLKYPLSISEISEDFYYFILDSWYKPMV